tara:strand:- start:563 stop:1765 length:1203 start_codon:yes stop_codon:yes gene_type:complete
LCSGKKLEKAFELCHSPLANNLAKNYKESINSKFFPLNLMFCKDCYHVQLEHVVEAKKLYKNYLYLTGISQKFREHFRNYAKKVLKRFKNNNLNVLEIGSNDCTLLNYFKEKKCNTVGIEPAKNIYKKFNKQHHIINDFYNLKTNKILKKRYNKFDLVLANNVFAHIDDLRHIFILLKSIIHDESIIIFEVSYLLDVLKSKLFDTIYHEHLDYHSLLPLFSFFKKLNLKIIDVEKVPSHGGSIRVYVTKKISKKVTKKDNINKFIQKEADYKLKNIQTYIRFHSELINQKLRLKKFFSKLENEVVYGYGAPAKAVTLINFFELNSSNINLIVDDSKLKQKKYIPGTKIKIYNSNILNKKPPKFIVILAWNLYQDILIKLKKYNKIQYAIIPLPKFKIVKL